MTMKYQTDHILVPASEFRPGDVDRLNQVLADAALGRPLRDPGVSSATASQCGLIRIPVDGADPVAIRDAMQAHVQPGGGELPTIIADNNATAGTTDEGTFFAAGKKSGHGVAAWLPAPQDEMPTWAVMVAVRRPPSDRPARQRRAPAPMAVRDGRLAVRHRRGST